MQRLGARYAKSNGLRNIAKASSAVAVPSSSLPTPAEDDRCTPKNSLRPIAARRILATVHDSARKLQVTLPLATTYVRICQLFAKTGFRN